jgi:hypothetical protein
MKLEIEQLHGLLIDRWGYEPKQVDGILEKLQKMDDLLQNSFIEYLSSDQFPKSPTFFGLSPLDISTNYPFKPPAVFLCLDWIRRDPKNALDALVDEYKKPLPQSFDPQLLNDFLQTQNH